MRCKDIERLMIDGLERTLSGQNLNAIEQHVIRCSSCARFLEDLQKIRNGLRAFSCPSPSDELVKKTRALCHTEMEDMRVSDSGTIQRIRPRSIPRIIWAALFALVVLTGILIVSLLINFEVEESLSLKTVLTFTLIFQNAAMLFFAPVLIQKLRSPMNRVDINGYENLVP
ncbi:zf-HC2 domain-containing protein [Acidobacteriota bacterium]